MCNNLLLLLGGLETKTEEQWLVFRDDGKNSAADFTKATSEKVSSVLSLQENSWNHFEKEHAFKRKTYFVIRLFQGAMRAFHRWKKVPTHSQGLWRRASSAGAFTPMEKRAFGIATDMHYGWPFIASQQFLLTCLCSARLLESTFKLDVMATRRVRLSGACENKKKKKSEVNDDVREEEEEEEKD
ncbi:hypothetical protein F3Y22_tig00111272pilonHSYRG00021 [Hibiscus syriacus]|uniref:Uncharacterized protein n=1 Tax=Hibiscus syriacus TaxID=106335 RepID=A0A6A2YS41_HIBSY|nr:hypothetical protein F3Y22_tig00111272pilonHSYRG00021 [Hibiscus syriacus]